MRAPFLYHPVHLEYVPSCSRTNEREVALEPFTAKPLCAVKPQATPRLPPGSCRKLLDRWHGHERVPNAQPGFGLPEVFRELGHLLGRLVPDSQHEARTVLTFYRQHGPLPREAFLAACDTHPACALGEGRPLAAYLDAPRPPDCRPQPRTRLFISNPLRR